MGFGLECPRDAAVVRHLLQYRLAGEERRTAILDEIERIARDRFANRVMRRMVTPLYTARRPA